PRVQRQLSLQGLGSYLFSDYVPAPATIFRGLKKLAPGHFMVWKAGGLSKPVPFWQLNAQARPQTAKPEELAEELWSRLRTSVRRQLISDVPVGIFLSGGIDSSTVAALAKENA